MELTNSKVFCLNTMEQVITITTGTILGMEKVGTMGYIQVNIMYIFILKRVKRQEQQYLKKMCGILIIDIMNHMGMITPAA